MSSASTSPAVPAAKTANVEHERTDAAVDLLDAGVLAGTRMTLDLIGQLELAVDNFREATDGPSNDDEHDAACELADLAEALVERERRVAAAVAAMRPVVDRALPLEDLPAAAADLVVLGQQVISAFGPDELAYVDFRGAQLTCEVDHPERYLLDVHGVVISVSRDAQGIQVRVEPCTDEADPPQVALIVGDDEPVIWVGRATREISWRGAGLRWLPAGSREEDLSDHHWLRVHGVEVMVRLRPEMVAIGQDGVDVVAPVPFVHIETDGRESSLIVVDVDERGEATYGSDVHVQTHAP